MWPPDDITARLWSGHCPVRFSCEPENSGPWGCRWWFKCDTGAETINPSLGSGHLQVMLNVHGNFSWSIFKPVSHSEASCQVFTWTWGCSSVSSLVIPSFLERTPLWLMPEPFRGVTPQGVVQHQAPPSGLSSLIAFRRVFSLLQPLAGGVLHHLCAEAAADWSLPTGELWGRPLMCFIRSCPCLKLWPQTEQTNGVSPAWVPTCLFWLNLRPNVSPHPQQQKGLSSQTPPRSSHSLLSGSQQPSLCWVAACKAGLPNGPEWGSSSWASSLFTGAPVKVNVAMSPPSRPWSCFVLWLLQSCWSCRGWGPMHRWVPGGAKALFLSHILQVKRVFREWIFMWIFKVSLREKRLLQREQPCGFSPVWVVRWLSRPIFWVNFLLQKEQLKGFSPVWILMCIFRWEFRVNLFPHSEQWKGFFLTSGPASLTGISTKFRPIWCSVVSFQPTSLSSVSGPDKLSVLPTGQEREPGSELMAPPLFPTASGLVCETWGSSSSSSSTFTVISASSELRICRLSRLVQCSTLVWEGSGSRLELQSFWTEKAFFFKDGSWSSVKKKKREAKEKNKNSWAKATWTIHHHDHHLKYLRWKCFGAALTSI